MKVLRAMNQPEIDPISKILEIKGISTASFRVAYVMFSIRARIFECLNPDILELSPLDKSLKAANSKVTRQGVLYKCIWPQRITLRKKNIPFENYPISDK